MPKKLTRHVHVDGVVYGPDDDVPADVAAKITNPAAWDDHQEAGEEPAKSGARAKSKS